MSMEINRDNYEAFLLDQLEGRLSVEEQQQLRVFLALHPECEAGVEKEDLWTLPSEAIPFPGKNSLRKEIPAAGASMTGVQFDLFSMARLEGDLTPLQVSEHEKMTAEDPRLRQEWEAWQLTRLPKETIVFPWKSQLKRKLGRNRGTPWMILLPAAAAVAMLVVLLILPSDPVIPLSQEQELRIPGIEQEHAVSPLAPAPWQERLERGAPATSEVERIGSFPQEAETVREQEGIRTGMVPDPGDRISLQEQFPLNGRNDVAVQTPAGAEEIPPERPWKERFSLAIHPAPVPEGTLDRIQPLSLPPSPIYNRNLALNRLRDRDLQEVVEEFTEEKDLSLWTIASAGIRGINRITGSELELYAARDEEGEVTGFQFKSKKFNIATPLQQAK